MNIKFVEIQNFRKLKSVRIDFSKEKTLFVGANNSGKTSAMVALEQFLVDKTHFTTKDFTLSNWEQIQKIGISWETQAMRSDSQPLSSSEWESILPCMDVWIQVASNEIHYVSHLLPTLDWEGGLLGIRLRLQPKNIEELCKDYVSSRKAALQINADSEHRNDSDKNTLKLWPANLCEFLDRRLNSHFALCAYTLDPAQCAEPKNGIAFPQSVLMDKDPLDGDPFRGLIRIDVISAQRGFTDVIKGRQSDSDGQQYNGRSGKLKLSGQLREYYNKHLDPSELPESSDIAALKAIDSAQTSFDTKLRMGFKNALDELEQLGYPGITDPKLTISTKILPMDGLNHSSAVQFEVINRSEVSQEKPLCLPEQYNGLGYQNLISMVFNLMSFRDEWMQVGKAAKRARLVETSTDFSLPRLHIVLIEEPEAYLHAQVQQVFIRRAYAILRNHDELREKANFATQMLISTHSSHIAHECEFSCLRYFRRKPAQALGEVPTSTVINLSEVFGTEGDTQRFVTRYLKTTHCDLFFADAAILVEGPAERMLVPHFIREHFEKLNQGYVTILEIGGSHAHRLRPLLEHLGLITLIITDLDATESTGNRTAKQPVRGQNLVTRNATLKDWLPNKEIIDELLDLSNLNKVMTYDLFFSIRVAYQAPITVRLTNAQDEEALCNTFEDALVFENLLIFKNLDGHGLIKKFKDAITNCDTTTALGNAMFEDLKTGKKAEFALDLLDLTELKQLKVPTYIWEGLSWLQDQLQRKQQEVVVSIEKSTTAPSRE